jgi:transporter family-2 protein
MSGQPVALYAALSLLGGVLIPITAALSGAMGRTLGNPSLAALIVITGSFAMVLAYTLAVGNTHASWAAIARIPALQWVAGFGIAFYLLSITWVAPRFGVGNAVMLVVAAQIASSAVIDHFGLFGAPQKPIDWLRAAGLVIMVIGVVIAQLAADGKASAHAN